MADSKDLTIGPTVAPDGTFTGLVQDPRDEITVYNFTPFLSCPAITNNSPPQVPLTIIPIPDTRIVSPLAPHIAPQTLLDLKEYLTGRPDSKSTYVGNGREVWESWKRAWDIWNGYYIEGRVNEVWVGGQLQKLEREDKERRAREEADDEVQFYDPQDSDEDMDRSEEVDGEGDGGSNVPTLASAPTPALAPANNRPHGHHHSHHGGQWDRVVPSGIKRKQSNADPSTRPPKKNSSKDFRPSLRGGADNFYTYDSSSDDEGSRYDIPTSKSEDGDSTEITYPTLPTFHSPRIMYPKLPSLPWSNTEDVDVKREAPKLTKKVSFASTDQSNSQVSSKSGNASRRGSPVKPSRPKTSPTKTGLPTKPGSNGNLALPSNSGSPRDDDTTGIASAGWKLMKYLPDYKEPAENASNLGPEWLDLVSNSVWRPRDVGEKTVKIHIDDEIEDFLENTELEVDGGVDCGRSPYPLLQPIYQYVETQEGLFKKKKVWDGVTGTVFNMPTKPLEGGETKYDAMGRIIKLMYSGNLKRGTKPDIFPLDIRRCEKVELPIDEEEAKNPKVESTDIVLKHPLNQKQIEHRPMRQDDPWWVTKEQRQARDKLPCRYPSISSTEVPQLTLDDDDWEEESSKDARNDARYFVTNLDGRTLLINGLEVRKGEIAGPLPVFAVIECPGGQIAFWWGQGGRSKGGGQVGSVEDTRAWDSLRRLRGWGHTGLLAGDVWIQKILHKIKKQFDDGEEEESDEWKRCREAYEDEMKSKADEMAEPSFEDLQQPERLCDREPTPDIFPTEDDELKFVLTRLDEQKQREAAELEATRVKEPVDNFWPGPVSKDQTIIRLTQTEIDHKWNKKAVHTLQTQRTLAAAEAIRKSQSRLWKMTEQASGKRKAPTYIPPDPKRVRLAEERARKEGADIARREISAREKRRRDIRVIRRLAKDLAASKNGWNYYAAEGLRAASLEYDQELERKRTTENLRRTRNGNLQPQIPPRPKDFMADADLATVEKFNADYRAEIEELQRQRVEATNARRVATQMTQLQALERQEDEEKKLVQNQARRKRQLLNRLARLDRSKIIAEGLGPEDSQTLNEKRKEQERRRSQQQARLRAEAERAYKDQQLRDQKIRDEEDLERKQRAKEETARKLVEAGLNKEEKDRTFKEQQKREKEDKRLQELAKKKQEEDKKKNAKTKKTQERLEKRRKEPEAEAEKDAEKERKEKEDSQKRLDEAHARQVQAAKDDEAAAVALAQAQEACRLFKEKQNQDQIKQEEEDTARRKMDQKARLQREKDDAARAKQKEEDDKKAEQEQIKKDKEAHAKQMLEDARRRAETLKAISPVRPTVIERPKAEVPTPKVTDVPGSDPVKKSFIDPNLSKEVQDTIDGLNKVKVVTNPRPKNNEYFHIPKTNGYDAKYATAKEYAETASKSRGMTPKEWIREQMTQRNETFKSVDDYYKGVANDELAREKEAKEEEAKRALEALKEDKDTKVDVKPDVKDEKDAWPLDKMEGNLRLLQIGWMNRVARLPGERPWGNPKTEPELEPGGGLEL